MKDKLFKRQGLFSLDDGNSPFQVLPPCGICQERYRYWGTDVLLGVTTPDGSLQFISLKELQPHHWTAAYPAEELEHFQAPEA